LNTLLDENFIDTAPDGHLRTKQDALEGPVAQDVESEKLENVVVHLHGDVAVVTGVNVVTGKGKSYVATVHFTDVFHKIQGHWKAIAAQENASIEHH
jgi:ketosteroid isomerase-like protein